MPAEIESSKELVKDIFTRWFSVPEYQRPYVWGKDEVSDLLEDLTEAFENRKESQYFLGSIVFQIREKNDNGNNTYEECDLLDGQQRLTTCLILLAVGRDLTQNAQLRDSCQKKIFQNHDPFNGIPERLRIVYDIRPEVHAFVKEFIQPQGGTAKDGLAALAQKAEDKSIRQMAAAILQVRQYFIDDGVSNIEQFFIFFFNKVVLVYVASPNLEDAFRLFTVLNNRGMKLRSSDILKTTNLSALRAANAPENEVQECAKKWEETENELDESFDVFLSHLRTILVKEKAKSSLLQEFEDVIYNPKNPLLEKGSKTFNFIQKYHAHYEATFSGDNGAPSGSYEFNNLVALLGISRADFWLPPLLHFRQMFGMETAVAFLRKLENKFSADWMLRETPTIRIENMNRILRKMEVVAAVTSLTPPQRVAQLLQSDEFTFPLTQLIERLDREPLYGAPYAAYLLYKMDLIIGGSGNKLQPPQQISVEHLLPQNPESDSQWSRDFSVAEREIWTHRLGNLVLIGRRKNSSMGRLEFLDKKRKYFLGHIQSFPNSIRLMQKDSWNLADLTKNHEFVVSALKAHYSL